MLCGESAEAAAAAAPSPRLPAHPTACLHHTTPQVWSCDTLTCTKVLEGHNEAVLALAVGDLFMASGSYDTTIRRAGLVAGPESSASQHVFRARALHAHAVRLAARPASPGPPPDALAGSGTLRRGSACARRRGTTTRCVCWRRRKTRWSAAHTTARWASGSGGGPALRAAPPPPLPLLNRQASRQYPAPPALA